LPKYDYRCNSCHEIFEITHSYKEEQLECVKCGASNSLSRVYSAPINIRKPGNSQARKGRKPGTVVVSEIEKIKKEIKKSQKELKNRKK